MKKIAFAYQRFNLVTEKYIKDFEEKYNIVLSNEYKDFLKHYNGFIFNWWELDDNINTDKGKYLSDKYGFTQNYYPIYEDIQKNSEWDWVFETCKLFGLCNNDSYLDMSQFNMEHLFWHPKLMKYAYPIGSDKGGNLLMQISQGKYQGKLAMLDHEVAGAMVDWIKGLSEDVCEKKPSEATVDEFLEDCFAYGGLTLYNITFQDFFDKLVEKHTILYQIIKKKYGK